MDLQKFRGRNDNDISSQVEVTPVLRARLIRRPWVDKILAGKKTWEIRGSRTTIRGAIGLIASGSGTVIGVSNVVDCTGPLTAAEFRKNARKAGMRPAEAKLGYYRNTFAWKMANAKYIKRPVPYKHPSGAVVWVNLSASVQQAVREQL